MTPEKNILSRWKDRIATESKTGDRIEACRNMGFTYTTHRNAMKKESISELTVGELKVLAENIRILDERLAKLKEYAAN